MPMIRKKTLLPPLGLLTVAAMLPRDWELLLVDLNIEELSDERIKWADVVMITGMLVQQESMHEIIARCSDLKVKTVVGGPYPTALPEEFSMADHVVLGEAEEIVPLLVRNLLQGRARAVYREKRKPELTESPVPRYDLLQVRHYAQMAIQYSRGCPYNCEFCDIIVLYGRRPRVKPAKQVIAELDAIRRTGFRGDVFFVDDNFIGNRREVKKLLPDLIEWRRRSSIALEFYTEATINIADDPDLLRMMTAAGFTKVFIGIESPSESALEAAGKSHNLKGDMCEKVHHLLEQGLDVSAGFILGFDHEGPDIYDRMTSFIERSAIPYAMVTILTALPNTSLYRRLEKEGRLGPHNCGDQFGISNVIPLGPVEDLLAGYRKVLENLYDPEKYLDRCRAHLKRWRPVPGSRRRVTLCDLAAACRALWTQGVRSTYRGAYWSFLAWCLRHNPGRLAKALKQAGAGHHFFVYTRESVLPNLEKTAARLDQVSGGCSTLAATSTGVS